MKHFLIVFICFTLLGCITTPTPATSELYKPFTWTIDDIKGPIAATYLPLYRYAQTIAYWNETFSIMASSQGAYTFYSATVECTFSSWRFIDTIQLKTDNGFYTLKDNSPYRLVISGDKVKEVITIRLSPEIMNDLKQTNTLVIQYYATPRTITPAGITALHSFLP